ncbi:leucine carboxyl methyltransferase 1-like [Parasteatoda tepidariorum]|uniref:leucine carboxyl methyltransferase 1-like n=1 Tax=Parasteatoda tepidariorum TaxID=114398 RepID=UPI00077F919B|nr:leucine carboxyl methyltransferase 1-like [Parasteatoda tepidariorum]
MCEDDAVIATNDEAALCKRYAVHTGYWVDPHIEHFIKTTSDRKAPEISRGYYARVMGMKILLDQFLKTTNYNCQVINIGAGFDTLYWRLKDENVTVKSFIEVDLPPVTSKKCYIIRNRKNLLRMVATEDDDIQFSSCELHAGEYHLVGSDIRNTSELEGKLLNGLVDTAVPTVFLSECVLVYNEESLTSNFLKWVGEKFRTALFINYEQVNMGDKFGNVMIENLKKRGCNLAGVSACSDLESQRKRFIDAGWDGAKSWDMMEVYQHLPQHDVDRIEHLEFLDEQELLQQLLQHYCITVAFKGESLEDIGFN